MSKNFKKPLNLLALCAVSILMHGCASVAVSLAGIGAGAGVNHQMNGVASRTYTESIYKTKKAVLIALQKMSIRIDTIEKKETGEIINGTTGITTTNSNERQVQIELESLSAKVTRMGVVVRINLFLVDGATAQEIIMQTNKALAIKE